MKKLICAATSLVMAATMVAAAVPAVVSAADATKGFSVKTYDSKNPSAASAKSSITINKSDIPADGYVIPTALYYSEATDNSTDSLLVALTTDSKDISFKYYDPADVYASEASTYTINGTEFTTNRYISFAGYCNSKREGYKAGGKYVFGCDPSQAAAGTDNYFLGCSWMNNGVDYKWAGASSDAYPFYVFDTVIPQNIKAGTYKVKFCDYNTDSTGVNNNPSPMVEGAGSRYTIKGGTDLPLKLEEFTINVVDSNVETTTTAKPVETTTTAAPVVTTTTQGQQGQSTSKADVTFDFVEYNSQKASITAKAGDKIDVDVNINAGTNDISALDVLFKLSDGLKLDAITASADAFPTATVSSNVAELRANYATLKGDTPLKAENGKSAFQLTVEVPAGTPDGVYTVGFGNQCKVFKDNTKFNYETAFTPLTITVGNPPITTTEKPAQTTVATTEKPATTTVTTQAQPSNADVKFDFVEYNSQKAAITAKAGDKIDVDVNINAGTNDISALDVLFKLSDGLKLDNITASADAFPTATVSSNVAELRANYATLKGDTPLKAENGKSAFQLTVEVPAGTPDGVYTVGFGDQCKVFKDNTKFNYTTSFAPLTITVGNPPITTTEKPAQTTVATTEKPATTTVTTQAQPSNADVKFDFVEYNSQKASITAKAGDSIDVDVNINAGTNDISALDVLFKLSDGLKLDAITASADAFPTATVSSNVAELRANYATLKGDTPLKAENGKSAFQLTVVVPAGTPDGVYTVGFGDQCKVFKDNTKFNYTTSFTPLTITVGETPVETTTTTEKVTTTEKETTTTTTTKSVTTTENGITTVVTTTAQPTTTTVVTPGAKLNVTLWGDTNCDGKVNVADVVVLNRLLNDPSYIVKNPETKTDVTAQGKVNADVVDPQNKDGKDIDPATVKLTAADSEAIAMSILEKGTIPQ